MKKRQTLYIKNPAAHRLAQQVSQRMGVTLTEAVIRALVDQMKPQRKPIDQKRIDAICAKLAALPVLDSRTPDEILGYDSFGVPRYMVIDTSAIIAIVLGEPSAAALRNAIDSAQNGS